MTTEKVFHAHLSLLLPHIPVLASLVCQGCLDSHSKVVNFIPGIQQQLFSSALEEFYLGGQTDRLKKIIEGNNNDSLEDLFIKDIEDQREERENFCIYEIISNEIKHLDTPELILENIQTLIKCDFCEETYTDIEEHKNHDCLPLRRVGNDFKICGKNPVLELPENKGGNGSGSEAKQRVIVNKKQLLLVCDICEKTFRTREGLDKHKTGYHGVVREGENDKLECPFCDKKMCLYSRAYQKRS